MDNVLLGKYLRVKVQVARDSLGAGEANPSQREPA